MRIKTVLVTGSSGFLGINLCRYLHAKGYKLKGMDVAEFDYEDMKPHVDFYRGDICKLDDVRKVMKDVDIVVHAAAALPKYTTSEIFNTDVEGTRNVLSVAEEFKVERVVFISSTAVYGIPKTCPITENSVLSIIGPYAKAKAIAEQLCVDYRKKGMTISVLRPITFVGPERLGVMAVYYDWIKRNKNLPIIGSGKNKFQLLDVEDFSQAIYLCMIKPKSKVNTLFNIGSKNFTTMREDFGEILNYVGSKKKIVPLPTELILPLLRVFELLNISPLYNWMCQIASKDVYVSIDKAERVLGFKPKYSSKQALVRNYQWYVDNLNSFKSQGVSHRVPWNQGILKIVSWLF